MIARPTSSPLPQEIFYSTPYEDPITGYSSSYIPYTSATSYEPAFHSEKRLKIEPQLTQYYLQTLDASNFNFENMQQSQLRTPLLSAPHINLHRPSEPASPVTVATTLSQHSTPSPSPSRVTILSDNSNPDWVLFDEPMIGLVQDPQQSKERPSPNGRHHYSQSSNNQKSQYNPMIVPQLDSSHSNSGFYPGFPYDHNMTMTDFAKTPQFLKPAYPRDYQELAMLQQQQQQQHQHQHQHQHDDEPPALSPSHHQTTFSGRPSVSKGDYHSPITPIGSPSSDNGARTLPNVQTPAIHIHHPIPKLSRTVSDAVEDELFHDSGIDDSQHSQKGGDLSSLNPQLARYYQQAQNQHITAAKSLTGQLPGRRETSPFRANSPFHPGRSQPSPLPTRHSNLASGFLNTARAQREHRKEIETEAILNQPLQEELDQVLTPKTISPKDAVLEYPEPEDEASRMSLFPDAQSTNGHGSISSSISGSSYTGSDLGDEDFSSMATSRRGSEANSIPNVEAYSFHPSPHFMGIPTNFQYLQPLQGRMHQTASDAGASTSNTQVSEGGQQQTKSASPTSKPAGSRADTGAYTCTEQGCAQRFPTPQKMAKHRRETHTKHNTPGSGMTSALSARHQGPHKCTRINPTTNKPCNTIFSRPYDLTRHEDTIHNTAREKVRCEICNDEKTFSRQDALTRHKKVKHGIDK